MPYPEAGQIKQLVAQANRVVIVQADNPDADSLGSALALEQILGEMGKQPYLYCGISIPDYLKYLRGWDRVSSELPSDFDLSIVVDASTMTLLERLTQAGYQSRLASHPCVVLDHHEQVSNLITFATVTLNDLKASSAGELIYQLARDVSWPLDNTAQEFLMTAILGDTQGLSNGLTKPQTYRIIADMIDSGVNRAELEERRREYSKMTVDIFRYKAQLIQRTELFDDNRIAIVSVPNDEINRYSPSYNPKLLIQSEMLQTQDVLVCVVFKLYDSGRITASIRSNSVAPVANQLAEHFGGGGHAFASGFKIEGGRAFEEVKSECISTATELLAKLDLKHETV